MALLEPWPGGPGMPQLGKRKKGLRQLRGTCMPILKQIEGVLLP